MGKLRIGICIPLGKKSKVVYQFSQIYSIKSIDDSTRVNSYLILFSFLGLLSFFFIFIYLVFIMLNIKSWSLFLMFFTLVEKL